MRRHRSVPRNHAIQAGLSSARPTQSKNSEPARRHLFLRSRPITNPKNKVHSPNVTASSGQSHLRSRRRLRDVTEARPAPTYGKGVGSRSRPPSRKWDHGSGALCSASRGPPPSSCTSTGPEGPGSASRPRPHPRRRHRHRRCRCLRTRSRWPRCLRWGRCGRVRAGRLPVVARVLAVPAYVGALLRLHPAPDACDLRLGPNLEVGA